MEVLRFVMKGWAGDVISRCKRAKITLGVNKPVYSSIAHQIVVHILVTFLAYNIFRYIRLSYFEESSTLELM